MLIELLLCTNFDLGEVWNKLESVILCSELIGERSREIPKNMGLVEADSRIEIGVNASESIIYRYRVVEVFKKKLDGCSREDTIWIRNVKNN